MIPGLPRDVGVVNPRHGCRLSTMPWCARWFAFSSRNLWGGIARYPARCYKSSYALYESGDSCDGRPRRRRETDATSTAGESIEGGSCSDRKTGGVKESSVNEEKAGAPCSPAFGVLMPNAPLKSASKFRTLPVYRNLHTPIKGIYQSGESLNGRTTSTPAV